MRLFKGVVRTGLKAIAKAIKDGVVAVAGRIIPEAQLKQLQQQSPSSPAFCGW